MTLCLQHYATILRLLRIQILDVPCHLSRQPRRDKFSPAVSPSSATRAKIPPDPFIFIWVKTRMHVINLTKPSISLLTCMRSCQPNNPSPRSVNWLQLLVCITVLHATLGWRSRWQLVGQNKGFVLRLCTTPIKRRAWLPLPHSVTIKVAARGNIPKTLTTKLSNHYHYYYYYRSHDVIGFMALKC